MKRQSSISSWCTPAKKTACKETDPPDLSDGEAVPDPDETVGDGGSRSDSEVYRSSTSRERECSVSTSEKDATASESAAAADLDLSTCDSRGEERISRGDWCEFFQKKEGGSKRRYVRCKICTSYPSLVALHCHRQRIPPIATVGGTRFRKEVMSDHEKHRCHSAAVRARRQSKMRSTDPLSVPLFAAMRRMELGLFKKIGAYMLDVYNDAQRGTL